MPLQWDNGSQGGPWGRGAKPGSESDKMVRQGKCRQFSNIRASSGATR